MVGWAANMTDELLRQPADDIRLEDIHGERGIAIYTYIDDHLRRVLGSSSWMTQGLASSEAYFYLGRRGELKFGGSFGSGRAVRTWLYRRLGNSSIADFFHIDWPQVHNEDLELYVAIIKDLRIRTKERFGVKDFVFSIYPGQKIFSSELKERLVREGITVFDFSGVNIDEILGDHATILGNGHPSVEAHRLYADLIVNELKKHRMIDAYGSRH